MPLSTKNRTDTLRWSKGAARLSCDSPKAPSRRPQGSLKDPWRYVEHRVAAVQAPYVSLAMLNFPGRPSHGDCEYHPFGYKYKYRDSCIAYHNLIVWRWRFFPHNTWDYLYVVSHRIVFVVHRCNWTYSTARHPHGPRTTHLLTVGSPHDFRPATGDRSYGRLTIKLFQFLKGTARTS